MCVKCEGVGLWGVGVSVEREEIGCRVGRSGGCVGKWMCVGKWVC